LCADHVFFELTKEDKVARAVALGCDVFVDDLPEILEMAGIRDNMRPILFDPEGHFTTQGEITRLERYASWPAIATALRDDPAGGTGG
jgi:hypothetical protein